MKARWQGFLAWLMQLALVIDQLLNVLLFFLPGVCWADETLSSRSWRCRHLKPFHIIEPVINRLFFWQKDEQGYRNHCQRSYQSERDRRHLPPEMRCKRKST